MQGLVFKNTSISRYCIIVDSMRQSIVTEYSVNYAANAAQAGE